jgi:5-methylcytosine-specific restriction endonuclease McrA
MAKRRTKKRKTWSLDRHLTQAARKIWLWSPHRKTVIARCKAGKVNGIEVSRCEKCRRLVEKVQVDHIEPVVNPETGRTTWDEYFARLLPEPIGEGLQGLCSQCHGKKTGKENSVRKKAKAAKK